MNQEKRKKKQFLATVLCLVLIITSIQIPNRRINAEEYDALENYIENAQVTKNGVDVSDQTNLKITDYNSLKVAYQINLPKTQITSGSAITMEIPEKVVASVDSVENITAPYTLAVSGSAIVLSCSGEDPDPGEEQLNGSFTMDYAIDATQVNVGDQFDFPVKTKMGITNYQIMYTSAVDFITDISLRLNGAAIGSTAVDKDSSVVLRYEFSCEDGAMLSDFSVGLPNEILVGESFSKQLTDNSGTLLCTASVDQASRQITYSFTDAIKKMKKIKGFFDFGLRFNKEVIGKADSKEILFDKGNGSVGITVNFKIPAIEPTITKEQGELTNRKVDCITTVTVGNTVTGAAIIQDTLDHQELVEGSVKVNGMPLDSSEYTYSKNSDDVNILQYTILDMGLYDESDEIKLEYQTKVMDSVYTEGETKILNNTSALYNSDAVLVAFYEGTAGQITVTPNCIEQIVEIDLRQKLATWSFEVNLDELDMYYPIFTWQVNDEFLTLRDGSFTVSDGVSSYVTSIAQLNEFSADGWKVNSETGYGSGTYAFNNAGTYGTLLDRKITITFITDIKDSFFQQNRQGYIFHIASNISWLPKTGGSGGGRVDRNSSPDEKEQKISYAVVRKQAVSYDEATGEILWKISLNDNSDASELQLSNVVITDKIGANQTFVPNSIEYEKEGLTDKVTVDQDAADGEYYEVTTVDGEEAVAIHYSFISEKRDTYIRTKVNDAIIYKNVTNKVMSNSIDVTADGIEGIQKVDNATKKISSQLLQKTSTYDEATHTITWKVYVNKSTLPINNPVWTDCIPDVDMEEYVEDSFSVKNVTKGNIKVADQNNLDQDLLSADSTLSYDFTGEAVAGQINDYYLITYKTYIYDVDKFYTNSVIDVTNTAKLEGDSGLDLTSPVHFVVTHTRIQPVTVKVVAKEAIFANNQYNIQWRITVNRDELELKDATITDCFADLPGDLEFDSSDIRLIQGERDSAGKWKVDGKGAWAGPEIEVLATDFSYDIETKTLVFHLPEGSTHAYQLTFTTKIKDKTLDAIRAENTAYYRNTTLGNQVKTEFASATAEGFLPTGGISGEESGTLVVNKYVKGTTNPIQDTKFVLYDKYGVQVGEVKSTDEEGKVTFDDLTVGADYTVHEVEPAIGYQIDDTIYDTPSTVGSNTFQATNSTVVRYSYAEKLKADITFKKVKESASGDGLAGATFALYAADDVEKATIIATAVSESDGSTTFEDIPYGDYTIVEKTAPTGYYLSSATISVSMTNQKVGEGAAVHYQAIVQVSNAVYINTTMPGSIVVELSDEETGKPIAGGEFKVYDDKNQLVTTFLTDNDGQAELTGIPLGTYTTIQSKASSGYIKSEQRKEVTLIPTNRDQIVEFTNHQILADIIFVVKGSDGSDQPVVGAEYTIYDETDTEGKNPIQVATSTETGEVHFRDLPKGKYHIIQTNAPKGYLINEEKIPVVVDDTITSLNQTIVPELPTPGTQTADKVTGDIVVQVATHMPGITYTLYDKDGNEVASQVTDASGKVIFPSIPYGEYTVKQTKAPNGYAVIVTEYTISITEQGQSEKSKLKIRRNLEMEIMN
ncbi:SpaA isopeptide-forming pilin-related protein [Anaerosporobacter faecicola]|uniref:SpaA isopeptide-forming pilin-related protein n=1 Tax=Anaerosporobacter faecicola TaxID=2718714 RepID=UPI00143927CD|nr:SpaA isopeptide-forming pilin-related protein [Anaerosporobacter faecicola]